MKLLNRFFSLVLIAFNASNKCSLCLCVFRFLLYWCGFIPLDCVWCVFSMCVFQPYQKKEGDGHFICTVYLQGTVVPEEQLVKVNWILPNYILMFLCSVCFCVWIFSVTAHKLLQSPLLCGSWSIPVLFSPQVPGSMTAAELTCEVLDRRNIPVREKDYWTCWEVCDKEDMGETHGENKKREGDAFIFCYCSSQMYVIDGSLVMWCAPGICP